eukprot:scaffold128856_cov35-Prasinocladus_malaysianus.AAC.1
MAIANALSLQSNNEPSEQSRQRPHQHSYFPPSPTVESVQPSSAAVSDSETDNTDAVRALLSAEKAAFAAVAQLSRGAAGRDSSRSS